MATNTCRNPSERELARTFARFYEANIDDIINGIEYFIPIQSKYKPSIITVEIPKDHGFAINGIIKCQRTDHTIWNEINQISTCPHHFVEVYREDMFPFKRLHAVCNCQECLSNEKMKDYGCRPNYVALPVLKRGECKPNGQYHWHPKLEQVSISCGCRELVTFV